MFFIFGAAFHNVTVRQPRWMRRKLVRIVIPAAAAAILLGGAGWFVGPWWALAGIARWMRTGGWSWVPFNRGLAAKLPMFRDVLADRLETMSRVLQALDNEPRALEAATEAAAIYAELTEKRPDRYSGALARTLLQQSALPARMSRHGDALAAIEPAARIYRRLAMGDRGRYLPRLG